MQQNIFPNLKLYILVLFVRVFLLYDLSMFYGSLCFRPNINELPNQPINLWYYQISWQLYLTTKNNLVWALATTGLAGSIVEQFYLC